MHRAAAIVLSALAIAAMAPTAFAEDRGAMAEDSRPSDGVIRIADVSVAARADSDSVVGAERRGPSPTACRERSAESCPASGRTPSSLKHSTDWSDVGPSADDFAPDENNLRLVGARLVGSFKF